MVKQDRGAPGVKKIWYGPFARLADWRNASEDARHGLPNPDSAEVTTQTIEFLERRARQVEQQARHDFERDTAALATRRDRLRMECEIAERNAKEATDQLAAAPPQLTEEEQSRRRAGEHNTQDEVVRSRRGVEYADHLNALRREASARWTLLDRLRTQKAEVVGEIRTHRRRARARVLAVYEYVRRRRAAYWRRLVRIHDEGQRIGQLLKPDWPEPPEWMRQQRDDEGEEE